MIVEATVLYRANIVRKGCRTEESCLLATLVPVNLTEASPPRAIAIAPMPNRASFLRNVGSRRSASDLQGEWFESPGGELLETFRCRPLGHRDTQRKPCDLAALLGRYEAARQQGPRSVIRNAIFGVRSNPFQTAVSLTADGIQDIRYGIPSVGLPARTPIYPETVETRSMAEAFADARNIAISGAVAAARRMVVTPRGGLLVPSRGPVVQLGDGSVPNVYMDPSQHLLRQGTSGIADALPERMLQMFRNTWNLQVERPEVVERCASMRIPLHLAALGWMFQMGHRLSLQGQAISPQMSAALDSVRNHPRGAEIMWIAAAPMKTPSEDAVPVIEEMVAEALRLIGSRTREGYTQTIWRIETSVSARLEEAMACKPASGEHRLFVGAHQPVLPRMTT